ncbi:MAG: NAD(P)-dependent oxidoreductase [Actinomycetota bacterium]|nr:NAD(P)-dependent oxidoreductase [Actinomycetota bacterium]
MTDEASGQPGTVGFLGIGNMGEPMAANLLRAGAELIVWNRTAGRAAGLQTLGARVARNVDEVFTAATTVVLMLVDEAATDQVLRRGTPEFVDLVRGHLVISTASTSPEYSRSLADDIDRAGGRYVEAPVSGSRKPAEAGQLVALLGGESSDVENAIRILAPTCRATLHCGPVGSGLLMKLAVNLYLDTMLAGLAEAVHFARANKLDLESFRAAIDAGPMASDVTRVKVPMLIARDFALQAATSDAYANTRLIAAAARAAGIATPLLDVSSDLYRDSVDLGNGRRDMSSVLEAIERRDDRPPA